MTSLSPLNKLGIAGALYLLVAASTQIGAQLPFNVGVYSAQVAFLAISPGALLLYVSVLVWRTRDRSFWSGCRGLPLRGRWLCILCTALLAVPATFMLLGGTFVTLVAVGHAAATY